MIIERINTDNIDLYKNYIFNTGLDDNTLAFGAKINILPCGIILAKQNKKDVTVWDIKILFVSKLFRRQGIGKALLAELTKKLKASGCKQIVFKAVTSKESIDLLDVFLVNFGFSKINLLTQVYRLTPDNLLKCNAFVKSSAAAVFKCPEGIKFVPMDNVDKSVLNDLEKGKIMKYPDNLSPLANEYDLNQINTMFAFSDKNEMVGWLTGLDAPGNMVLYRSFFVREDYRNSAIGFFLLCECIKNHIMKFKDKGVLCAVSLDNYRMLKFISIYFKNSIDHMKYEFETSVDL